MTRPSELVLPYRRESCVGVLQRVRGLDPALPTRAQLPSAMRVRGAYLVLPPAPFRGRSPPASPTSTPVFDCVFYSQRDGTRANRTEAAAEKMDLFSWTRHRSKGCVSEYPIMHLMVAIPSTVAATNFLNW